MRIASVFSLAGVVSASDNTTGLAHPPTVYGACIEAVSMKYPIITNRQCMDACNSRRGDISKVDMFKKKECVLQTYSIVNGRTDVTDTCFNKWVYGYSEPEAEASMIGTYLESNSPAECQALCQEESGCVNWIYFVPELYQWQPQYIGKCVLKNSAQVDGAIAQKTGSKHIVVGNDFKYCNSQMPTQCSSDHYNCLQCSRTKRCVWESANHVAGFVDCAHHDECNPEYTIPTNVPKPSSVKTHAHGLRV